MILLKNIAKTFDNGASYIVNNLSLNVQKGEILVLLGSSGCGKTTTLKMINRLIEPSSGLIEVNGQNIQTVDPIQLRRSIGYVFQGIGLFPHMSVEDNISVGLRLLHKPTKERREKAQELLALVNLSAAEYAHRYPRELSGGQQQRVGVARALATGADILLMDEPFGALDAITREELQTEILRLNQQLHKTIIFVTHDLFEALRLGDRIAVMRAGQIEQVGEPTEIVKQPASEFVRDLFVKPAQQLRRVWQDYQGELPRE